MLLRNAYNCDFICKLISLFIRCKDGVVAIPKEFKEATVLGDESAQFDFLCSVDGNDMR